MALIASALGVTRQAISATARDLEGLGYLERDEDPRDRRSSVWRLSARGDALIVDSVVAVDELETQLAALLGAKKSSVLETSARALAASLAEVGSEDERPGASAGSDLERLADDLRRRLGLRDARRLGALLAPPTEGKPR